MLAYVGKPPTRHTKMVCRVGGILCWYMSVNLQHDITMVCRVGGILCWRMSVDLQHDTPIWYIVLEVYCVGVCRLSSNTTHQNGMSRWRYFVLVYVSKPPIRHNNGMSCWRYFVLAYVGKPPTRHSNGMSCWRYFVLAYVGKPPTRHTKMARGTPHFSTAL